MYFLWFFKKQSDFFQKRYPNPENELPVLNNTILNSEVNSIDYSKDDDQILITTTSGKTYKADHVIVTVSLGVLKEKHSTLFVPVLREKKVKAIEVCVLYSMVNVYE